MIVRELLTLIGFQVDTKGEKKAESAFTRLKKAAGSLGIALSAGAIALGFKKTIDAASDVEETMNVVTTAFEDQANSVLDWARVSGDAAGRSEFAMREYAATLGAVVGPTLGSAEATAQLSTDMAQLAVDLGSFFNATDEDALDAIRAGLIGSNEPLLRFGVNMRDATLKAFALSQGIRKQFKDFTEAEKIQLRYQFILANTTKAQGDAEKTSDGFANQSKRLAGNLRDLAVGLGRELLPAAAGFLQGVNRLASAIKGPLVLAFRALLRVFKFVHALVGGILLGFKQLGVVGNAIFAAILTKIILLKGGIFGLSVAVLKLKLIAFAGFILWAAIIAGIILIIDDLWAGFTKGEGVFASLGKEFLHLAEENDSYAEAVRSMLQTTFDFWLNYFFGIENGMARLGQSIRGFFGGVGEFMSESIAKSGELIEFLFGKAADFILNRLLDLTGFLNDNFKPVVDAISKVMIDIVGFVSDIGLGDIAKRLGLTGPENITVPGSPAAAAAAARNVQANQSIEVNVNATGGDPAAIAGAVAPAVGRAAGEGNRQVAQQLLAGGATP